MAITFSHSIDAGAAPGLRYEAVDISSTDWTPSAGGLFRGIWISVAGNVVIKDVDGNNHTFSNITVGLWPLGGQAVVKTLTTATVERAVLDHKVGSA